MNIREKLNMDKCYNFEMNSCFNSYDNYIHPEKPDKALKSALLTLRRLDQTLPGWGSSTLTPPVALNLFKSPVSAHSCNYSSPNLTG